MAKRRNHGRGSDRLWRITASNEMGVIVRPDLDLASQKLSDRLSQGAIVKELALVGDRLHFRTLRGTGPRGGWITIRLGHKELAVPILGELGELDALHMDARIESSSSSEPSPINTAAGELAA